MQQTDKPESGTAEDSTRPQQAGEAGTTRFGMEDGDNTDVAATGGPVEDEEEDESGPA
jgi:hypothetical protein